MKIYPVTSHPRIALLGCSGAGKTAFFNRLQHVRNDAFNSKAARQKQAMLVVWKLMQGMEILLDTLCQDESEKEAKGALDYIQRWMREHIETQECLTVEQNAFVKKWCMHKKMKDNCATLPLHWFMLGKALMFNDHYFGEDFVPSVEECIMVTGYAFPLVASNSRGIKEYHWFCYSIH